MSLGSRRRSRARTVAASPGSVLTARMMTALLLYAYCVGVFSSRRVERATYEDVAFRVLSGGAHPHFTTVNAFRLEHREALAGLFVQVLQLCSRAGLSTVGHVSLDGSKIAREREQAQGDELRADEAGRATSGGGDRVSVVSCRADRPARGRAGTAAGSGPTTCLEELQRSRGTVAAHPRSEGGAREGGRGSASGAHGCAMSRPPAQSASGRTLPSMRRAVSGLPPVQRSATEPGRTKLSGRP